MGWLQTTIDELIAKDGGEIKTGPFGTTLKASEYAQTGVPLISVGEVGQGRLSIHAKTPRISPETIQRLPEYVLKSGDIVFGRKGSVERSALVQPEQDGWFLGSDGIRLRLPKSCDPRFVGYWLQTYNHKQWILCNATGSTMASLNQKIVGRIPLPLPPLPEQRAIASVLSSLDDKIELNRRMNGTLEAMARALFRDWFVDFGPTRAKMAGGAPYLAPEIWPLFPDRLDDDGVPEGWEPESVIEQAEWINGAAYKNMHFDKASDALPVIKIAELKAGVTQKTKWTNTALGEKYRISDGELLFSWSGNPDTSIDTFIWTGGDAWLNQHIFAVRSNGTRSPAFLYTMLKWMKPEFAEIARNKQTTGLGHVTKQDLKRLKVHIGSYELLEKFEELAGALHTRMRENLFEIDTLTQTRDLLLPKLMSGEIRVREAVEIVAKDNVVPFNQNKDLFGEPVLTEQQEMERDAVIVAAVVRGFGRDGTHVVGNVKYQKGFLFVKRRLGVSVQGFQKMTAGPYNPDLAHRGGFGEACKRRFIRQTSRNGFEGNVPAENMAHIGLLMDQYGLKDAIDWVIAQFRDKDRDELGLLATVDHIMCERKKMGLSINATEICKTLGADPEWQHKISQPEFSESKVRQAISELEGLFGETP